MNEKEIKKLSKFFKALAHPVRLMIIKELLDKKRCVGDIEQKLELRQSNISQHLIILKSADIVDYKQDGNKKCYYLINPDLIQKILEILQKEDK
ncbi:MAG: metalloregulator ArsR/SmtB family transcription factor [Actinobacteria bacterium]|nr:metalloregulator ArsR/SmtB family transcription factor [Cyanobacteriota bacterium]MCL5772461.1 metalloregulator ArsR/SmtB family transcription factor [Actinomycetota bacterium]